MSRRGRRTRIARNIYRDANGISGVVRVKSYTEELRFPHGTPTTTIWRDIDLRREELRGADTPVKAPEATLREVVAAYVKTVGVARETDRDTLLQPWVKALGDRVFSDVRRTELLTVIEQWTHAGLSASRTNKRISALRVCWERMAPEQAAAHPIMAVTRRSEPPPICRSISMDLVTRILDAVPNSWAKSRVRLRVLAWTGQPPVRIMAIEPGHVRWDTDPPQLWVSPRRKGTGSSDAWIPLVPQAVDALTEFFALKATGPFTLSPLGGLLRRAVRTIQAELRHDGDPATAARLEKVTVYSLRHSFLTLFAEHTDDIFAVAEYAGHASLQTTRRYMKGASLRRMERGVAALTRAVPLDLKRRLKLL